MDITELKKTYTKNQAKYSLTGFKILRRDERRKRSYGRKYREKGSKR